MKDEPIKKPLSISSNSTQIASDFLVTQKQFEHFSKQLNTVLSFQTQIFDKKLANLDAYEKALKIAILTPTTLLAQHLVSINIPTVAIAKEMVRITQPTIAFTKMMTEFTKPQVLFVEALQKSLLTALNPISNINLASYISTTSALQLNLATNISIKKELLKPFEKVNNGVLTQTSLVKNSYSSDNQVSLRFQKDVSTIKSEIQYQKLEIIDTKISVMDSRFSSMESDISEMKKDYSSIKELLTAVENDPFKFLKVNSFDFVKEASIFVVNNTRKIRIESKTIQDYICQVLFSNTKGLGEEWFWEDILKEMVTKLLYEGEDSLTWKSVQDAIAKINIKIATETTIKDAILIPRSETVQLNPLYFHK